MRLRKLAVAVAAIASSGQVLAQLDEIVVTAQKRAESLQDVPISVSAFDAEALDQQQIQGFDDLQFNVPNVSYSKTNFSGSNFQIRGIGTLLTAASGDSGVAMHINDVYLNSPRVFETEYYDLEQLEVLRGPQGTLFGRNATGGAVNLKTARPVIGEWLAEGEVTAGNYDNRRAKGMVNVPVSDTLALRFAGVVVDREGYTDNVVDGQDVDGRDQWSLRGSLRWLPDDKTTIDVIGHLFEEDSNRTRSQKMFCDQDPSPVLGCLPTERATDSPNPYASSGTLLSSNLILGGFGLFDPISGPVTENNPDDWREIRSEFQPEYEAEERFLMLEVQRDLSPTLSTTFLASWQDTEVSSVQDYTGAAGAVGAAEVPAGWCAFNPASCEWFGTRDGGPVWKSTIQDPVRSLGAIAGGDEFELVRRGGTNDLSLEKSEQYSAEWRFTTHFEGDWNFMASAYYLDFDRRANYFTKSPTLDWPATVIGSTTNTGAYDPATEFVTNAPGAFNSDTPEFNLESWAVFGEAYWNISPTMKLTLGLRRTVDKKSLRDRQLFLNLPVVTNIEQGTQAYLASDGTRTPVGNLLELMEAGAADGQFSADPNEPGSVFRDDSVSFKAWTGRAVLDWMPEVAFTNSTLVYFSYGRGYKGGGLNPPIDTNLFPNTATTFDSEKIDAWEIGTKNTLFDERLQANLNLFYYDYGDLQIGKIINRTSLNENTDASIWGTEAEFVFAPTENWVFNTSISYLNTELDGTETVDPRDPTQGRDDVSLFKDFATAANCAVAFDPAQGPASENAAFVGAVQGAGAPYIATGAAGGNILPATPGVTDSAVTSCEAVGAIAPAFGYEYLESGVETNLDGNELLNAPEWTVSVGGQYTHYFDNGLSLTGRVDYYWQDSFYSTTFNAQQDKVDAYGIVNAQATLSGANDSWYLRGFVRNLNDKDAISGTYSTDGSSGLFTNAFLVEPRLYGATVGLRF